MKENNFKHHSNCTPFECLRFFLVLLSKKEGREHKTADDFIKGHEDYVNLKTQSSER